MKQIDYAEAIHLLAFSDRTDVAIYTKQVEPMDYLSLRFLENNNAVMFFIPDDPEEETVPAGKKSTPPPQSRRQRNGAKLTAEK